MFFQSTRNTTHNFGKQFSTDVLKVTAEECIFTFYHMAFQTDTKAQIRRPNNRYLNKKNNHIDCECQ